MMNIREYFEALYSDESLSCDDIDNMEQEVYDMEGNEFVAWADEHDVDLSVVGAYGITELQYWRWDMGDE